MRLLLEMFIAPSGFFFELTFSSDPWETMAEIQNFFIVGDCDFPKIVLWKTLFI